MKMCFLFLSVFWITVCFADHKNTSLDNLDEIIDQREKFTKEREIDIAKNKELLSNVNKDPKIQYELHKQVALQYIDFQIDSAIYFADTARELSLLLNDNDTNVSALLLKANVLIHAGFYAESISIISQLSNSELKKSHLKEYYALNASLYRFLSSYVGAGQRSDFYNQNRIAFQDSALALSSHEDENYLFLTAETLENKGKFGKAKEILLQDMANLSTEDRAFGPRAYRLATIYKKLEDTPNELKYLVLSSISDLRHGVKEHASLRELALRLFEKGEVKQAYRYMTVAMEDALFANARIRSFEILEIFPVIDSAYNNLKTKSETRLLFFISSILLLLVVLIYLLIQSRKKSRLLEKANQEIKTIFEQLLQANKQLKQYSTEKEQANLLLKSSVDIQEQYIAKYLRLCSSYIGKIDSYRKMLYKKKKGGATGEEMIKILKSKEIIDEELKDFYKDFDEAFLTLHPDFLKNFNTLLKPNEQIQLKKGERLNTELRIFALIRLGIIESPQIAEFLRYSLTTIYNYRTRIRNRALGERDEFESKVMKL